MENFTGHEIEDNPENWDPRAKELLGVGKPEYHKIQAGILSKIANWRQNQSHSSDNTIDFKAAKDAKIFNKASRLHRGHE